MGGATIWPIPKAVDLEAFHYPRMWKRNFFFLYSGLLLMTFQLSRFAHMCRVSSNLSFNYLFIFYSGKFVIPNQSLFVAIDPEDWRVHGLGQPPGSQESQILITML